MLNCFLTHWITSAYLPQSQQPTAYKSSFSLAWITLPHLSGSASSSSQLRSPSRVRSPSRELPLDLEFHSTEDLSHHWDVFELWKSSAYHIFYLLQCLAWNQPSIYIYWVDKWINKRIHFWIRSQVTQTLVSNLLLRSLRKTKQTHEFLGPHVPQTDVYSRDLKLRLSLRSHVFGTSLYKIEWGAS